MDTSVPLIATGMKLELGHSCYRHLTWECVGGTRADATLLAAALPSLGYIDKSYDALIRIFISVDEHTIVLIPRTGRIQIRIHYLTPVDTRADAAEKVMTKLICALAG